MSTKNMKFISVVLFILGALVLYVYVRDKKIEKEINENKFTTVALIIKFKRYTNKTSSRVNYVYFFRNNKYEGFQSCKDLIFETGKFYKVDVSSINPEHSRIHLDKQVKDSTEIVNAGFTFR